MKWVKLVIIGYLLRLYQYFEFIDFNFSGRKKGREKKNPW